MGVPVAKKKKKPRKRRSFSDEYKAEVVDLIRVSGKSIGQVAREMDLTEGSVRDWVKKAEESSVDEAAARDEDVHAQLRAAKKRIKELEMERAILKKATAFFAKESS